MYTYITIVYFISRTYDLTRLVEEFRPLAAPRPGAVLGRSGVLGTTEPYLDEET